MTSTARNHKPLHNFSLPFLNWGQKPRNTDDVITTKRIHRKKTPSDVTHRRRRTTPRHDHDDVTYHDHHHKTSKPTKENSEDDDVSLKVESDKLVEVDVAAAVEVELEVKPWKLRPRRAVTKGGNGEVKGEVNGERSSGRLLRTVEVVSAEVAAEEEERERGMKRRLWISLSKDEIEQDMLLFTGAKAVRRPKKRTKIAQKHLDNVFPGLYLVGMSADSYRL